MVTLNYRVLIEAKVNEWCQKASVEDLIKHGVIARVTAEQYPVPDDKKHYDYYLSLGMIQGVPRLVRLRIACQLCPHVFERKAVKWIIETLGGSEDPNRVRAAWNVVNEAKQQQPTGLTAKEKADERA